MYRAYYKRLYLTWVLCLVSSTVLGIIFHICCFIVGFLVSACKGPWYIFKNVSKAKEQTSASSVKCLAPLKSKANIPKLNLKLKVEL